VDFGTKLISRLDEFTSATEEVPASFRSIKSQLPLAISTLRRVQEQAHAGRYNDTDAKALKPVVDNCLDQMKKLTALLESAVPAGSVSTFQRRLQALKSLRYDKKVQKAVNQLQSNIQILIFYLTAHYFDIIREEISRLTLSPPISVPNYTYGVNLSNAPQIAQEIFVGRQAELKELSQLLAPQSAALGQNIVAISAAGGLGKTQLSIKFVTQHQEMYSSVFWLKVKDEVSLKQDFVDISRIVFADRLSAGCRIRTTLSGFSPSITITIPAYLERKAQRGTTSANTSPRVLMDPSSSQLVLSD
jgi:hypothetical protein